MYENYLIDADAVAHVLNQTETFKDQNQIDASSVEQWLADNMDKDDDRTVDGAALLTKLFSELSDGKETYRKTIHSADLTRFLLQKDPDRFSEVRDLIEDIFNTALSELPSTVIVV